LTFPEGIGTNACFLITDFFSEDCEASGAWECQASCSHKIQMKWMERKFWKRAAPYSLKRGDQAAKETWSPMVGTKGQQSARQIAHKGPAGVQVLNG
jgi:hypothetical protein